MSPTDYTETDLKLIESLAAYQIAVEVLQVNVASRHRKNLTAHNCSELLKKTHLMLESLYQPDLPFPYEDDSLSTCHGSTT